MEEKYTRQEVINALGKLSDYEYTIIAKTIMNPLMEYLTDKTLDDEQLKNAAQSARDYALESEITANVIEYLMEILHQGRKKKECKRQQNHNRPVSLMESFHHPTQWRSPWTI